MSENGDRSDKWQIVLTFTTDPWEMTIEGNVENGDMALAMLDQARRKVETDMRIAAGMEAQMAVRKKLEEEARVQGILSRGGKPLRQ